MKILISLLFICLVLSIFNIYSSLKMKSKLKYIIVLSMFLATFRYIFIYIYMNLKRLDYMFYFAKILTVPIITFTIAVYLVYIISRNQQIKTFDWSLIIVFTLIEVYLIYIMPINFIKTNLGYKFIYTQDIRNYIILLLVFFSMFFIFISSNYIKITTSIKTKIVNYMYILGYIVFLIEVVMIYLNISINTYTLIPEAIILLASFIDLQ